MADIRVTSSRYDELIAREERLLTMESALMKLAFYNAEFDLFKKMFGLEKKTEEVE